MAKRSSLLVRLTGTDRDGRRIGEKSDARIAVLAVQNDDLFIYATAEDEYVDSDSPDLSEKLDTRAKSPDHDATWSGLCWLDGKARWLLE